MASISSIFHLRTFASTKLPNLDDAAQEANLIGSWRAFQCMQSALKALSTQHSKTKKWQKLAEALQRCYVGFVANRNNLQMSTSLGCAALVFKSPIFKLNDVGLVFHFDASYTTASTFRKSAYGVMEELFHVQLPAMRRHPNQSDMMRMVQTVHDKLDGIKVAWSNVIDTCHDDAITHMMHEYYAPITTKWPKMLGMSSGQLIDVADFAIDADVQAWFEDEACKAIYTAPRFDSYEVVSLSACDTKTNGSRMLLSLFDNSLDVKKLKLKDNKRWMKRLMLRNLQQMAQKDIDWFVDEINTIIANGKLPLIPFASGFAPMFANVEFFKQVTRLLDKHQHIKVMFCEQQEIQQILHTRQKEKKRSNMFSFLNQFWPGKAKIDLEQKWAAVNLKPDDRIITDITLPTLVAHGDESAGKSTLLQELIQFDMFDVGDDMITRMVWRYRLRYSAKHVTPYVVVHIPNKQPLETTDPHEVKRAIQTIHDEIKTSKIAILDQEGLIEIFSNLVPNIDIIDLPGSVASPKEGEPTTLAETSRRIAKKYLSRLNHIIMYVQSSTASERTSVAAGLIYEAKCQHVLTVYTKVDNAIDARTAEPLQKFMDMFRAKDHHFIAISNYRRHPVMSFLEVREEEQKFFIENLSPSDYDQFHNRLGMNALMAAVNNMAESMNKSEWVQTRLKAEQTKLAGVHSKLATLGKAYSTQELCAIVADSLLEHDPMLLETLADTWQEMKVVVPTKCDLWMSVPDIDANVFATHMCGKFMARLDRVFELSALKLNRFDVFQSEYARILMSKLSNRNQIFLNRWAEFSKHIAIEFYTGSPFYSPDRWSHALKTCYIQHVLLRLHETDDIERYQNQRQQSALYMHIIGNHQVEDQEVGPPPNQSFKSILEAIGADLSAKENVRVQQEREDLLQQIAIYENIITNLPTM